VVDALKRVRVVDYDPSWPELFEALRATIWSAVSDVALAIEHVGSTSVPGLAAKPVIDLDVIVTLPQTAACIARLATLGYEHQGDLGIPQREAFLRPAGSPAHHLYVCVAGSHGLLNHLAIRDFLRANPAAAREYGELKTRLAAQHSADADGYTIGKTQFIIGLLRRVGLPAAVLDEIERLNL
jgi:GrpB-like predicted nucleotidyltransferase (UPF0157 family)